MANEQYQKIIEKITAGLDKKAKEKVEQAMNIGYKTGVNTFSHNFGNSMQDILYAHELYIQNPTGEDTKKCINNQRKNINKISALISMLLGTDIKDAKIEEYPPVNSGDYIINADEIMKENEEKNGEKKNGQ